VVSSSHKPAKGPDDWIARAKLELKNISGSYHGRLSNDVKIECALLATEAALKAIIWKKEKWPSWPSRQGHFKFLYGHNYEGMLDRTGLRIAMHGNPKVWASWQTLTNAALKQYRYSPEQPPDNETHAIVKSARDIEDGVVPWLLKRYQEMT
jgi:hypothetical protein